MRLDTYYTIGTEIGTITLCDECAMQGESAYVIGKDPMSAPDIEQDYCEICDREEGADNA